MRRKELVAILGLTIFLFCMYNVYQSSTIEKLPGPYVHPISGGIEILSGGQRYAEENLDNKDVIINLGPKSQDRSQLERHFEQFYQKEQRLAEQSRNEPKPIDTIPGVRRSASFRRSIDVIKSENEEEEENLSLPIFNKTCHLNISEPVYKNVNGTKRLVPLWQRRLETCGRLGQMHNRSLHFALTELLQVRIYENDKAKWTIRELKQWIHFILLAGVEHIFVCDHYANVSERLDIPLRRYISYGLVTYIPWSSIRDPMTAQVRCYQHIIDKYKEHSTWGMAIDMDEYPYIRQDSREGFLLRYLRNIASTIGSKVTEISMENYLMLGQGDRSRDMVIDRINRITHTAANVLVKPIFRPKRVKANVHHNHVMFGVSMKADAGVLKMLHYWGARDQDWGPDTPNTLRITEEMDDMRQDWAEQVRNSLLVFGEFDAFSNTTGP